MKGLIFKMYRKKGSLFCALFVLVVLINVSGCAKKNPIENSSDTATGVSGFSKMDAAENTDITAIRIKHVRENGKHIYKKLQ